jgi:hypothetical protein
MVSFLVYFDGRCKCPVCTVLYGLCSWQQLSCACDYLMGIVVILCVCVVILSVYVVILSVCVVFLSVLVILINPVGFHPAVYLQII